MFCLTCNLLRNLDLLFGGRCCSSEKKIPKKVVPLHLNFIYIGCRVLETLR